MDLPNIFSWILVFILSALHIWDRWLKTKWAKERDSAKDQIIRLKDQELERYRNMTPNSIFEYAEGVKKNMDALVETLKKEKVSLEKKLIENKSIQQNESESYKSKIEILKNEISLLKSTSKSIKAESDKNEIKVSFPKFEEYFLNSSGLINSELKTFKDTLTGMRLNAYSNKSLANFNSIIDLNKLLSNDNSEKD